MNSHKTILLLAMASLAFTAAADLWVHEPFDIDSVSDATNGPAGGTGWQAGSVWAVTNTLGTLELGVAENLEMGRLVTTGAALRITNPNQTTGMLKRGIDIAPPAQRSSVWASYLVHYSGPTASGTYQYQNFDWSFRNADTDAYVFSSMFLTAGSGARETSTPTTCGGSRWTSGTTTTPSPSTCWTSCAWAPVSAMSFR